ncbi:nitroreductase family protein [Breznakiella homolactica]|uniref:Nitroreductase family protein n=1 Tax=Breznakiella homolactica TaxID=2798577 RepID=A0A7T7XMP0_9SPIR|nr:nitroreductase family protein [Breznakiella homolactica]QQO09116.1 nitroreductase family protein [Breznakiella homolactica]
MTNIFKRRSVRKFLPQPVEQGKITRILHAAMEAPSAINLRPWEFLVVTDAAARKDISRMSPYAGPAEHAPVIIAVCVDLTAAKPRENGANWWIQDLSAATENMLLQIVDEDLGGVWLGWYPDGERVRAFSGRFSLPSRIIPFSLVALGYPEKQPEMVNRFDVSRVHYEKYSPPA